jgi:regulator of cell morphogenesis and NO signaling
MTPHGLDPNTTVGQLVAERPGRAEVFERLGIDYCCGGKLPLLLACSVKGLDVATVLQELEFCDAQGIEADADEWMPSAPGKLADFIVTTHHAYLRRELPRLDGTIDKVAEAHGCRHPELRELRSVFAALRHELEAHMIMEEWVVFPLVQGLGDEPTGVGQSDRLAMLIPIMEHEHLDAGAALARMRELTNGYSPPSGVCNTYRALLEGLAELETDLHHHIHRENNLLFPAALGPASTAQCGEVRRRGLPDNPVKNTR